MGDVTTLIARACHGDQVANALLFTWEYAELIRVAERQVRRIHEAPMHATNLVHESYLCLARKEALVMRDRAHYLAEILEIIGCSERSLKRDWRKARAFLHAVLGNDQQGQAVLAGNAEPIGRLQ